MSLPLEFNYTQHYVQSAKVSSTYFCSCAAVVVTAAAAAAANVFLLLLLLPLLLFLLLLLSYYPYNNPNFSTLVNILIQHTYNFLQ